MQFSKLAFLAAIASAVSAQTVSISDLPTCALAPAVSAIGTTGCGSDIACVCKNSGFLTSLTPQIQAVCSAADFQKAVSVAVQLCAQAGVTITPPGAASTAAPATSSAGPATSAPASTSVVATTSVAAVISTTTSAASTTSMQSSSSLITTTSATVAKNGSVTTSAVPSVVTANAAAVHGTWAAAGLLGVGALLAAL